MKRILFVMTLATLLTATIATQAEAFSLAFWHQPPPDLERISDVVYTVPNGRPLHLNIIQSRTATQQPRPAMIYIHGGGWRKGTWRNDRNALLARNGYFTVSVEYRFSQEALFPAQIHDVKAAVRWLRAHAEEYNIDPKRIGVWGFSAGGHLAALLGTSGDVPELEGSAGHAEYSSSVQAAVVMAGPTDFAQAGVKAQHPNSTKSLLLGGPLVEHPDRVRMANPITYIGPEDPPFLIVHGDRDRTVPFSQAVLLEQALTAAGVEATLIRVRNAGHGYWLPFARPTRAQVNETIVAFFDRHLRP